MTRRFALALPGAALVTFALLFMMQALVWRGDAGVGERRRRTVFEFVRLQRDTEVEERDRRRPQKPERAPAPSVPTLDLPRPAAPRQRVAPEGLPVFDPALSIVGGANLGSGLGTGPVDSDVVPLVRVAPQYPPRALAREIEGWVHLRFTITPSGGTDDVEVLDADPKGYFERAAKGAVERYKYKPQIENGVAVPRPGVELVISFDIDDSGRR